MSANKPSLRVMIGDSWQPRLLPYFSMAMMALMLVSNVLNLKFIDVASLSIIASQLTYVLSLILADIMSEVYGYHRVRRVLYIGLGGLAFYALCMQIAVWAPPAATYHDDAAFKTVFTQAPQLVTAGLLAYLVTEICNSYIMSRLKIRLHARHFMVRALLSVGIAQIVNAVTFFGLAFAGVMPLAAIVTAGGMSWLIVMGCEILVLPATRRFAFAVKAAEGVEHFDSPPPGLAL